MPYAPPSKMRLWAFSVNCSEQSGSITDLATLDLPYTVLECDKILVMRELRQPLLMLDCTGLTFRGFRFDQPLYCSGQAYLVLACQQALRTICHSVQSQASQLFDEGVHDATLLLAHNTSYRLQLASGGISA